jgi:GNAT superfamily N-acetyltransferase
MIEEVTRSDVSRVRGVISAAIHGSVASCADDARVILDDIDRLLKWWLQNRGQCIHRKFTAEGSIVGMVLVREFWNLSCLFVLPECQRRGIGKALLADALSACRGLAPDSRIKLNSSTYAVPFYLSQGFKPNGPERDLPGGCVPLAYEL